jgi:anti-sigma factor RsiW
MKNEHLKNDLLIDYLRGELPPEDDALVHVHLDACSACRREYEIETSLGESLRAAARREELEFPSLVAAHVWETIRNAKPSPISQIANFFRPAIAVPLAAAAVVALFFATPFVHTNAAPKVSATYYLEVHAAQQAQNPLAERGPAATHLIEMSNIDASTATELADAADGAVAAPAAIDPVR